MSREGKLNGGGDALGSDATFLWSRALTHPQVKLNASPCHLNPSGRALSRMVAILDFMPSFGFGFRDIIGAKGEPILLPCIAC